MKPFSQWTEEDVLLHNIRVAEGRERRYREEGEAQSADGVVAKVVQEKVLHSQILDWCKHHGWYSVHSRMDKETTANVGLCDFILFGPNGRFLLIEAKSATGKLTTEQQIFIAWLEKLGHSVHVIRSFTEFLEIVK